MGSAPGSVALKNKENGEGDDTSVLADALAKRGYQVGRTIGEGSYCKVKVIYRIFLYETAFQPTQEYVVVNEALSVTIRRDCVDQGSGFES